jgi:hypothetical protein
MKATDEANSDLDMIVISKALENKNIFEWADMLYKAETEFIRIIKMPVDIIYIQELNNWNLLNPKDWWAGF